MKPPTRSGPVLADRVHGRRGDQLGRLLPVAAHEPAAAALAAIARRRRRPRANAATGSAAAALRGAPALEQAAADVRVLEPDRRVRVPGERRAARAAARLVVRAVRDRCAGSRRPAISHVISPSLTYTFHEHEPVQLTPCVERTTLSWRQRSRYADSQPRPLAISMLQPSAFASPLRKNSCAASSRASALSAIVSHARAISQRHRTPLSPDERGNVPWSEALFPLRCENWRRSTSRNGDADDDCSSSRPAGGCSRCSASSAAPPRPTSSPTGWPCTPTASAPTCSACATPACCIHRRVAGPRGRPRDEWAISPARRARRRATAGVWRARALARARDPRDAAPAARGGGHRPRDRPRARPVRRVAAAGDRELLAALGFQPDVEHASPDRLVCRCATAPTATRCARTRPSSAACTEASCAACSSAWRRRRRSSASSRTIPTKPAARSRSPVSWAAR